MSLEVVRMLQEGGSGAGMMYGFAQKIVWAGCVTPLRIDSSTEFQQAGNPDRLSHYWGLLIPDSATKKRSASARDFIAKVVKRSMCEKTLHRTTSLPHKLKPPQQKYLSYVTAPYLTHA